MMYTAEQMRAEVERVMAATRKQTLEDERRRVANLIYLHGNTLADPNAAAAVLELIAALYVVDEQVVEAGSVL